MTSCFTSTSVDHPNSSLPRPSFPITQTRPLTRRVVHQPSFSSFKTLWSPWNHWAQNWDSHQSSVTKKACSDVQHQIVLSIHWLSLIALTNYVKLHRLFVQWNFQVKLKTLNAMRQSVYDSFALFNLHAFVHVWCAQFTQPYAKWHGALYKRVQGGFA